MCLPALNFVSCEHKNYCTCSNDGTRCCSVPKDLKKAGFENNVPDISCSYVGYHFHTARDKQISHCE